MSRSLIPTLKLSLDMTSTLADIEYNGLKVNPTTLAEIREQFTTESAEIERRLQDIIWEVMGDTPINPSTRRNGPKPSTSDTSCGVLRRNPSAVFR